MLVERIPKKIGSYFEHVMRQSSVMMRGRGRSRARWLNEVRECSGLIINPCAKRNDHSSLISLVVQAFPTLATSFKSAGTLSLVMSPAWTHKPQPM